ncbi:MAG: hypothetical protein OEX97_12755, partial [Acidimicrobiia bacterium]|nr:hypothetical protein [Acidimicrobiia bacterium]
TVQAGFSVYETYVRQGKAHALYGGLTDLRVMLVECFTAIQSLSSEKVDDAVAHRMEATDAVPASVTEKIGYNLETTLHLLGVDWTDHQADLLELFPDVVRAGMLASRSAPTFLFMDEDAWYMTYRTLVEHFVSGDEDWESLLFRLWVTRVINYTATRALRGYDHSQQYLESMVAGYVRRAAFGS